MADFAFDLKPKPRTALIPPPAAVSLARSLITELANTWHKGSSYPLGVQAYSRKLLGEKWFARISIHDEPWDWFKAGICDNHSQNEVDYIDTFESYSEIDPGESGWKGIHARYRLGFPLSIREMPEWILAIQPDPDVKEFFVISVPADVPVSKNTVRGRYASIEYLQELPDGKMKWTMAFTSDGGGFIPRFIQNLALPSTIAKDVPKFLTWAKKKYAAEQS
ncbi:hypothetical protein V1525DRAFT_338711 [Lipomyces kononenkoae]|uniref:Uncharacterized protein n=1 Tax=Lipomyces kononenkoae TaxID=34357 RepID=A0ACC3T743_LIPKO